MQFFAGIRLNLGTSHLDATAIICRIILVKKFDQLAELQNGIRHSRTVDDVTRREGEAAVLRFKQVLVNIRPRSNEAV